MGKHEVLEECRAALFLVHERLGRIPIASDSAAMVHLHSARRDCSMAREHIARAIEEISDPIEVSYRIVT